MNVTIDTTKNELVIRIPMGTPQPSATGKTLVVASSRGNFKTDAEHPAHPGKKIVVGLNAYIPR